MRTLTTVAACAVVFLGTYLAVSRLNPRERGLRFHGFEGDEVGLVLIASPTCSACNDPSLLSAWESIKERVQTDAETENVVATFTGLSVSVDAQEGLRFLETFGPFHELHSGRGWENLGVSKFLSGNFAGRLAVPQVLLFSRSVSMGDNGRTKFEEETVIQRRVGLKSIVDWSSQAEEGG